MIDTSYFRSANDIEHEKIVRSMMLKSQKILVTLVFCIVVYIIDIAVLIIGILNKFEFILAVIMLCVLHWLVMGVLHKRDYRFLNCWFKILLRRYKIANCKCYEVFFDFNRPDDAWLRICVNDQDADKVYKVWDFVADRCTKDINAELLLIRYDGMEYETVICI